MSIQLLRDVSTEHDERRERAALAVVKYVKRHALGLYEVVEMSQDEAALDAVGDLISDCDAAYPDASRIEGDLARVQVCLDDLPYKRIETWSLSCKTPRDPYAAHAWHGAQVSDLLRAF